MNAAILALILPLLGVGPPDPAPPDLPAPAAGPGPQVEVDGPAPAPDPDPAPDTPAADTALEPDAPDPAGLPGPDAPVEPPASVEPSAPAPADAPADPATPEAEPPHAITRAPRPDLPDLAPRPPTSLPPPRANWRLWASPLASALLPGFGQALNGQGGKGTGLLFGSVGSVALSAMLYVVKNDGTRSTGAEYARLVGFGAFSTAAPLLWIYAVADAYRVAADKPIEPNIHHQVRVSATRMMTVGFRADPARPGFYDDWSVSIMGQAARRLSVGVSDLSIKSGGRGGPQIWQFGARLDYRVFDRRRVWIDLALGSVLQVVSGPEARGLDPDVAIPPRSRRFAAVPYAQLDVRVFVLDRLSLDLVPRLAVPVTTRYYAAQRALPRFAPTLELGAGVSTYF